MAIHKAINYKILGDDTLRELPTTRSWTPNDGISTDHHFVGPADKVQEYFNEISALGSNASIDEMGEEFNGKSGKLLCRVFDDSGGEEGGNTEALNSVWELIAQQLLKPVETLPTFDKIIAKDKRDILKAARNAEALTTALAAVAVNKTLYALYANSVMDYLSTDLILRKTTRLSGRSEVKVSYTKLNKVVAIGTIDPPTALLGILTSLPRIGKDNAGNDLADGPWEWVKLGPQVRQITKKKFQLVYTWHGAQRWLTDPYGGTWVPKYEA